jgi:hypothetical protein
MENANSVALTTPFNRKYQQDQPKDKDNPNIPFTLYEDGISIYFDELEALSVRYTTGYTQKRIIQLSKILKNDKYESIVQQQILYDRIEQYKRNEKAEKDYLSYLEANGIDQQFWRTMYETEIGVKRTLKQSEKTFKSGIERLRKNYPDKFNTPSNDGE